MFKDERAALAREIAKLERAPAPSPKPPAASRPAAAAPKGTPDGRTARRIVKDLEALARKETDSAAKLVLLLKAQEHAVIADLNNAERKRLKRQIAEHKRGGR